jgi:hypothetical protein
MNRESERMLQETVVTYFEVVFRHSLGKAEENRESLSG